MLVVEFSTVMNMTLKILLNYYLFDNEITEISMIMDNSALQLLIKITQRVIQII